MEGFEVDENCNRNGCIGVIQERDIDGCCSCHIHPPCGYCTTPKEYCPECGWDSEEDYNEITPFMLMYKPLIKKYREWEFTPIPPRYCGDELKPIWCVNQYFDEIYEKQISNGLTKEEADNLVSRFKRTIYTKWDVAKNNSKY